MASLKNVLEDIVLSEAIAQLKAIDKSDHSNLSEIVAYALNRLPPLYASTDRGWLQQRKRAHSELISKIQSTVRQAILGAKFDPLRQVEPLPEQEIETPAHSLAKLQKLLGKPDLTWQNVPAVVQETLEKIRRDVNAGYTYQPKSKREVTELQDYLKRSKYNPANSSSNKTHKTPGNTELGVESEFQSYMLSTSYAFTNALEKLVVTNVEQQMTQLGSVLARAVKIEDAAAYALNRLPTMYATSAGGLQYQQQKAKTDLADEISSTVIQALLTLGKAPTRMVGPLPINKFDLEEEQALLELKPILQRDEITWRNVVPLLEEAFELAKGDANRLTKMLDQINRVFQIHLDGTDLSLVYDDLENILIIKALTKYAFWLLVENPQVVANDALQIFPAIASIKLVSPVFAHPLIYTRQEMEEERIS
ncbi:Late competence development protein ComFB [Synechococcus sp. PCC 7502]|uniref:late competence development ComFB family protein n=1 Tax=Synechococcus sp. PCC 7502 TaxID=1173263 RepID=UPI00029F9543|nr:late competence development ComFB family protein [Synechococcus sp. PCC 7502]AFY74845.1 Late competence development protein ComFB [Synechococcus sp. PCC 7502]